MAEKKTKRLNKVAREFNVGISTIVEFLNSKGNNLDNNPNSKITEEMYHLLVKEYSTDIDLKKESERIITGKFRDSKEEEKATKKEPEKPKEKKEQEHIDTHVDLRRGIKVVGKIDLDKKPKPKEEEKEEAPKQETTPTAKEKPVEDQVEDQAEEIKEQINADKSEVENQEEPQEISQPEKKIEKEKPVEAAAEKEAPEEPEKESPKEEKKKEIESSEAQKVTDEEQPQKTEKKSEEQKIETKTEKLDDVKVVGKIDLGAINQKTRPAKKSRKEKEEERKERDRLKQEKQKEFKDQQKKHHKDQGAADDSDDANKRKRKRIRKDNKKVDVRNELNRNKFRGQDNKRGGKGPGRRRQDSEVSEEDVQKQIKETLARLTNKSKSKASKYRREKRDDVRQKHEEELKRQEEEKKVLQVTEFVTVNNLATMMNVPATEIISTCMSVGLFVSINQRLDAETIKLVAEEFGYDVEFSSVDVVDSVTEEQEDEAELTDRAPIVTVMGHVDHGKTSLLDYIRRENVIAGEAGGITQHIGAYHVTLEDGRKITFLDTPGHEAFTAMRARGAKVTDIVIIIIAADDNVMPQTVEAINHASAAGVPIVFAINKIDKPNADVEKIKQGLANMNYLVEDWGGKYQCQEISAKNGLNIDDLMEKVLLEAELLELKANPKRMAKGSIIESSLDRGRGYIATVLVETGTLHIGDVMLAGSYSGHVKAMFNERNQPVEEVGPSEPVIILGLNGAPQAGDNFHIMESEREARDIATKRQQLQREQGMRSQKHITLDEIGRRIAIGNFQELNIIVKGDVDGSIEALSDSLIKLSTEQIQVNVIHKAVGQISESDIMLAAASEAIVVGFQVRPSLAARKLAEKEEIDIRLYSIIYDAIEELKSAMEGMLSPEVKEEIVATAEVRETFKITKVGTIAGCMVKEGKINRNNRVRVIRDGIVVYTGELGSLKRFKEDVKEVASGYECGLNVSNYNDIKVGDIIEAFKEVEVKQTL